MSKNADRKKPIGLKDDGVLKDNLEDTPAEPTRADGLPASETGSLIEPVTKDDPTASRQPSLQKHPPRAKGP